MPTRVTNAPMTALLGLVTGPVSLRRRVLRVLAKITGGGLGVVLVIGAVVAYLLTLRPDIPAARRLALNELKIVLEPGERVQSAAWARRREWWDGFRETYGILAITETRALFVGIPPRELLSPERGPQPFVLLQLARDASLTARRERVDFGTASGLVLENDRGRLTVASSDVQGVAGLLGDVSRGRKTNDAAEQLGKVTREYERDVSRREVWHVVAAGDALASVATRYGTTEEKIAEWNALTGTTIKIGQRLLVKPGR
jgi:hypothetical protein